MVMAVVKLNTLYQKDLKAPLFDMFHLMTWATDMRLNPITTTVRNSQNKQNAGKFQVTRQITRRFYLTRFTICKTCY